MTISWRLRARGRRSRRARFTRSPCIIVVLVILLRLRYKLCFRDLGEMFLARGFITQARSDEYVSLAERHRRFQDRRGAMMAASATG